MVLVTCKERIFKIAVVNACLLLCLLFISCTGDSGDKGDSDDNNFEIPTLQIQLDSLDSWEGIEPFADDSIGDASDSEVDIERVYFSYDDNYFYIRINIIGNVDDDIDKNLRAEIRFIDDLSGYELFFNVNVNKVEVHRIGNEAPPCITPQQMMSYPGNEFLEFFEHAMVFKVRLADIDFLEEPIITQPKSQVRFEFTDSMNDREYWFTAWLNQLDGEVWIQDLNLPVPNDSGTDVIKSYPAFFYLSIVGSFIEYKVMKADIGFDLKNGCIGANAFIIDGNDYTDSVLLE
jgi:hypothetical protein